MWYSFAQKDIFYTLGEKDIYDDVLKRGGNKDVGGSVWKTRKEALDRIKSENLEGYDVYGVLGSWEKDTEIDRENNWRKLKKRCKLINV